MAKVVQAAAEVRKALVAAAAVLTAITAVNGVPAGAREWVGTALAVLATFGITHQVPNKEPVGGGA